MNTGDVVKIISKKMPKKIKEIRAAFDTTLMQISYLHNCPKSNVSEVANSLIKIIEIFKEKYIEEFCLAEHAMQNSLLLKKQIEKLHKREPFHLYLSDGTFLTTIYGAKNIEKYFDTTLSNIKTSIFRKSLIHGLYVSEVKTNDITSIKGNYHDSCPFNRQEFVMAEYLTLKSEEIIADFKERYSQNLTA